MRMKNLGFTLIETIVVFAVISILSTIAVASFVSYNKTQNVQTAFSELSATLALARSRALSQVKPQQCANLILNGYDVILSISDNTYKLRVICSGTPYEIQAKSLPKNVIFDGVETTSTLFYFSVITNGATFSQANAPSASISIYLIGSEESSKTITVDKSGAIR